MVANIYITLGQSQGGLLLENFRGNRLSQNPVPKEGGSPYLYSSPNLTHACKVHTNTYLPQIWICVKIFIRIFMKCIQNDFVANAAKF